MWQRKEEGLHLTRAVRRLEAVTALRPERTPDLVLLQPQEHIPDLQRKAQLLRA